MAECPQMGIGVNNRKYADPLKYASFGSLELLLASDDEIEHNAETKVEKEKQKKISLNKRFFIHE